MRNSNDSYTNQDHVTCGCSCKLPCVDDKFSKNAKTYLDFDAAYRFITDMIKESRYCSKIMNKKLGKDFAMTKNENESFKILNFVGT